MNTGVNVKMPEPDVLDERQILEDERAFLASARAVKYLLEDDADALRMQSGVVLRIPRRLIDELADAPTTTLESDLTLAIGGDAFSVRSLDVDISVAGVLRDVLGFNIQRLGGRAKTEAKSHAAKINGKKGGAPRKSAWKRERSVSAQRTARGRKLAATFERPMPTNAQRPSNPAPERKRGMRH